MSAKPDQPASEIIGPVVAAQILKFDRSTVRRMADKGLIPVHAFTPGGNVRFLKAEIEQLRDRLAARTKRLRSLKSLRRPRPTDLAEAGR